VLLHSLLCLCGSSTLCFCCRSRLLQVLPQRLQLCLRCRQLSCRCNRGSCHLLQLLLCLLHLLLQHPRLRFCCIPLCLQGCHLLLQERLLLGHCCLHLLLCCL
jgi:hypothetical protein